MKTETDDTQAEIGPQFPDTYLHVYECRSGQAWIRPIGDDEILNLEALIAKWALEEFGGELKLDPPLMARLEGDYYGKIMTDGRPPDSIVCWESGGFYLKHIDA